MVRRRAYIVFFLLMAMLAAAGYSITQVSGGAEYVDAAGRQGVYKLEVAKARGVIYDCRLQPLTSSYHRQVAAIAPGIEAIGALEKATQGRYRDRLALALEDGKPFSMVLPQTVQHECVDLFTVPVRYSKNQLAPHVVGYLDSMGRGAAGIELAMDDMLSAYSGEISVYYHVDALGRVIAGDERLVVDTMEEAKGGVALTLDSALQERVQEAAQQLGQGAVVVTESPNCEIRALASVPDYSPENMAQAAGAEGSPLLNRAFCAYAPGSVFKVVTASAGLEGGGMPRSFTCTGALNTGGLLFHCIDGTAHGQLGLRGALEKSCNCYFINAARAMGGQQVLSMAHNMGFGMAQEFGRGLRTQPGVLPKGESLENVRALGNFAFGQGELTTTPLQLCAMMNCVASDGVYSTPKLILGQVDGGGVLTPLVPATDYSVEVLDPAVARQLQGHLKSAAKNGTGRPGAGRGLTVGIKTGTAQTGIIEEGEELLHFWYSGFLCDENGPRYCITVLREAAPDDGGAAAKVFKEVTEDIAELYFAQQAE